MKGFTYANAQWKLSNIFLHICVFVHATKQAVQKYCTQMCILLTKIQNKFLKYLVSSNDRLLCFLIFVAVFALVQTLCQSNECIKLQMLHTFDFVELVYFHQGKCTSSSLVEICYLKMGQCVANLNCYWSWVILFLNFVHLLLRLFQEHRQTLQILHAKKHIIVIRIFIQKIKRRRMR